MFVVVVEFEVRPETADAFRSAVLEQARNSLELEPDCHVFDVAEDEQRAGRFLLYEKYSSPQAFDEHLTSEHFRAFDARVTPWVLQKTVTTWSEPGGQG